MSSSAIRALEFERVLKLLHNRCQFSVAAERALTLGPTSNSTTVSYLLDVTEEAVRLLEQRTDFSVGGVRDIRRLVERAERNSVLMPAELFEILGTVSALRSLRSRFVRIDDHAIEYPHLSEFVQQVSVPPGLEADLSRSVGESGDVLDSASEELGRIRRSLRTAQSRAAERIRRYTTDSNLATALQEQIVTTRDGRYVVPVRADRRSQLPGMVHDTSASGQTLFVEPAEMVELNNRVRELQSAEQHEIDRILARLTAQVADAAEDLEMSLEATAALDVALAKARLAGDLGATRPVMNTSDDRWRIVLNKARHPLLPRDEVVPISLSLGESYRVLVITGPNTGGKTVALKTVGLCSLMMQTGMFIPADEGSELPVFDGVFADIGDEQSIEQSLSTFSSHMVRVISALQELSEHSLVLFDELGAGTDPQEGAALARAIIERLLEVGCLAVTTTHYSELKTYAYSTSQVENASVEFDIETLSPTYRLSIGIPGRSNALAIAERLGMPEDVLTVARSYLDPDVEHADVLITEIRRRLDAAEEARREAERLRSEAQQQLREAEEKKAAAEREALAEIEQELAEARERIRELRQLPERVEREQFTETRKRARGELEQASAQIRRAERRRGRQPTQQELRIGDVVELPQIGGEGEIVAFSEDGAEVDVQMGAFKVRQLVRDVRKVRSQTPAGVPRQQAQRAPQPRSRVDMELHLRGQRVAGIEPILDDYLNDAYLSHMPFVRIVHGKGTGALREAVREVLRRHPLVESFETPPANEGGDGVTIAYLRES